jgi:hypothetical protein
MPPNNNKVLLDQVIELLEIATQLDKSGRHHRIEAATKYYESCYLMRQILAGDAAGEGLSSLDSSSTIISTTCRRLLEDKIEHYTKVAQRLYFDDSASVAAGGESPAPTSVIISLLDDVVSVLTSTNHPLEQQHPSSSDPFTATLPQQQYFHPRNVPTTTTTTSTAVATTRSNPSTLLQLPVQATIVRRGGGRETVGAVNSRNNPESLSKQQQQQQQQQQQLRRHFHNNDNNNNIRTTGAKPRARLSKFAKVEAERKIHIKMNLANSKLGQSIDLDEYCHSQQQSNNQNSNNIIIDSYVEASEFYLDAIKLAEDHQKKYDNNNRSHLKLSLSSKVDPWRGPGASPSPSPIGTVIPKLKHLLISALDRVETLKMKMKKTNININTKIITKQTMITTPRYDRSPHHSDSYSNHHRNYDSMKGKKQLSSRLSSASASASASASLHSLSLTATIIVVQN